MPRPQLFAPLAERTHRGVERVAEVGEQVLHRPCCIIDNAGGFHGWVAVEASLNQTSPSQGTSADGIGVFELSEF
ncbi:hypothetical protein ACTWPT_07585 [Nonomuraea sp. 3N208]|uniref:hypothetical protein n=1 Tax=Nonomuraea sp. 3N208 TaxID=3457421 RepID=UPI003FCC3FAB